MALLVVALVAVACGSGGTGPGSVSPVATSSATLSCKASAGLSGLVNDRGTGSAAGSAVAIEAEDFAYAPTCVHAEAGQTLRVTIRNLGQALHNFSVTGLGINKDVPVGRSIVVNVKLPRSGLLSFFCKYHVSAGMQGAFLAN